MGLARRVTVIALAAGVATLGCTGDPCEEDAIGCEDDGDFALAPDCELEGPLEVGLGQGDDGYATFAPGEEPLVHEGVQGGHHLCLGFRVDNPALEYPHLKVRFEAEVNDPEICEGDEGCDPWVGTGDREIVLGPELPVTEEGIVGIDGLILIISVWPEELERRVRFEAIDPCGREGAVEHVIPPAP